jgi:hypothetical protein
VCGCVCVCVCVCVIFFIHSLVVGHLSHYHSLAVVKRAATNMVCRFLSCIDLHSFENMTKRLSTEFFIWLYWAFHFQNFSFFFRISVSLLNSSFITCTVFLISFNCLFVFSLNWFTFYTYPLLFHWSFL